MAWARVLIAIVLARPGTPSTRTWPRASSATINRSSRWSCPTMTFLTSYRRRSIAAARSAPCARSVPFVCSTRSSLDPVAIVGRSVRRGARGAAGDVDRHGEADADEDVLLGGVDER